MNVIQSDRPNDSFNVALERFILGLTDHDLLFLAGTDDRTTWPKLSSSDEPAGIYWRIRDITNYPKALLKPAGILMAAGLNLMIKQLGGDKDDFILAPVPMGSISLTVATSIEADIPHLLRREEEKTHGTGGKIIGNMDKCDKNGNLVGKRKIILIDDVRTSGGNMIEEEEELYEVTGEHATYGLVVCDRMKPGAEDILQEKGIILYSCFTQETALDMPVLKKHPNRARVDAWLAEERWPPKHR